MNSLSTQDANGGTGNGVLMKWFLAATMALLAACATIGARSPQEAVKERAQARWDALVKGDFQAAYAYLSPGSREVLSEANYVGGLRKGFWTSAKVEAVECISDAACNVDVTIDYEFQGQHTRTPLRESWVREGSEWWYLRK